MSQPHTITYSAITYRSGGVTLEIIYNGKTYREEMTKMRFDRFRQSLPTTLTVWNLRLPMSLFKIRVRRTMIEYFASL